MTATIPAEQTYGLARIAAALDADRIDRATPDDATVCAICGLFPDLTPTAVLSLWAEARIDAAALGQLENGDLEWPLTDMDPPRRTSARFDTFLIELERTVDGHIRQARHRAAAARARRFMRMDRYDPSPYGIDRSVR